MRSIVVAASCLWLAASSALAGRAIATDFDRREVRMERSEALFLERLFELLDGMVELNQGVTRWFLSEGREGLHFEDYRPRAGEVLARLGQLAAPERVEQVRGLLLGAVGLQRDFFADWHAALEAGRPFDSQLTSEFGYHEGLHRSQRQLLDAYGRLLALFPREGDASRRSFHDQLCRLDLACGGAAR